MTLTEVRQQIVYRIAEAMPDLRSCEAHGGRFTAAELARVSAATPAVRVACVQVASIRLSGSGERRVRTRWVATVTTTSQDRRGVMRDELALEIVERLSLLLVRQSWGIEQIRPVDPDTIVANNLFGAELEGRGIAMWAVSWEQDQDVEAKRG